MQFTEKTTQPGHLAGYGKLYLNVFCDICGKPRSTRKHAACSRKRVQLIKQAKNAEANP